MNLFIQNKYTRWYMSIISNPNRGNETYTESHHIIPRSLGGEETINLSAREHFICHWLLIKMVEGKTARHKMENAFAKMCFQDRYGYRYINSNGYKICRERIAPEIGRRVGLWNKGKPKPSSQIEKMKAGMKGKHKGKRWCSKDGVSQRVPQERYDELLEEGWAPGRSLSDESRQKMRENGLAHKNNLNYFPPAAGVK